MKRKGSYFEVRRPKALEAAWQKVRANGIGSKSDEIREAIRQFHDRASYFINGISKELLRGVFSFKPAKGVAKKRKGKRDRPIVIAPIANRIVQRSILEELQKHAAIRNLIDNPTSYGGIKDKSTSHALKDVYQSLRAGQVFYAKSDIKDFFCRIDRAKVIEIISKHISDADFLRLLDAAVATELENMDELKEKADLFPIHEIGVAQGCCLSPLFGNILLSHFDRMMNVDGIQCFRYIDDVLILARRKRTAETAFNRAKTYLNALGFEMYDPFTSGDKGAFGETKGGFEFLGCSVRPGMISPAKSSRLRLVATLEEIFTSGKRDRYGARRETLRERLFDANNVILGWGEQYSYCNDGNTMRDLDNRIGVIMRTALARLTSRESFERDPDRWRKALGVKLLTDCSRDPIVR